MRGFFAAFFGGLAFLVSAQGGEKYEIQNHSFATSDAVVKDIDLNLTVDFDAKKIIGVAHLTIDAKEDAKALYLDTSEMAIKEVTLGKSGKPTPWKLGDEVEFVGKPLVITLEPKTTEVNVSYETLPKATGLQWLEPSQTAGKKLPYLFTQSEPTHARTWIPCQDTPSVRVTYSASVRVPKGMLAIMSAENPTKKTKVGIYQFKMKEPIPSYLLALAVGDIAFEPIGKRAGVYSEPSVVKAAAKEFRDLPAMMDSVERLYGPYRWDRYDVLVLPPSFPWGGMENPRLTFLNPTVIAGDRSLVATAAHELAHSWSGNLVTNASWDDVWLNEGVTTYVQGRIVEAVYGKERADMEALIGLHDLTEAYGDKELKDTDRSLKLNLKGRDAEDAFTNVPYEKGAIFLRMLEETYGRAEWDGYLRNYFDRHVFQPMTTEEFLSDLDTNLISKHPEKKDQLQLKAWVYGPTLPSNVPTITSKAFVTVDAENERWKSGTKARELNTKGWVTAQWLRFISNLPSEISHERMADLDRAFGFTKGGNAEILTVWFTSAIRNRYEPAYESIENFLTHIGRQKFLRPLYKEFAKTPEGTELAKKIYTKARPGYHAIAQTTVDKILKWSGS